MSNKEFIKNILDEHIITVEELYNSEINKISTICDQVIEVVKNNNTIFFCGNGGSAADSQHVAAELVGRFEIERKPLKAIALTVDTSILTCISNDYKFDEIFSRQLEAIASEGDYLIAFSTSGKSKNIINVLKKAKEKGVKTCSLLGKDGGEAKSISDISLIISSKSTARIQEAHILVSHIICSAIDRADCY